MAVWVSTLNETMHTESIFQEGITLVVKIMASGTVWNVLKCQHIPPVATSISCILSLASLPGVCCCFFFFYTAFTVTTASGAYLHPHMVILVAVFLTSQVGQH